ncbi:DUF814 domain-containing protein [bacterium]|nr:DUF814 domain-containing protein [bacterium]
MDNINLHRYPLSDGWTILAGKSDRDNDMLSTRIARQNDYWFHVKGLSGSHVILHSDMNDTPDQTLLKTAASVAAWHSKARACGRVAVSCVQARYVTKPKTAKPGTVRIRNERVLRVKPALPEIINHT